MPAKKRKPAASKEPQALKVGTWAGRPNYECVRCGFKSLDRETALEHVLNRHAVQEDAP